MKILYLTPGCFDKGGISRYSRYQITAWREILGESNLRVLSLLGPSADSFEQPFKVRWHGNGARLRDKFGLTSRAALLSILWRPDVIHVAHVNLSGLAHSLARVVRATSVVNTYGLEVWSGLTRDAAWGLRNADVVLSDCHFTARFLESERFRPADTVRVVWDCVDPEKFSPGVPDPKVVERYGIPDPSSGINVLTLGRMSTDSAPKGYERLLQAFSMVAARLPALRLVYAGRGDLIEVLRARASAQGLGNRVFFTGAVHEDHLADVYRAGHIFSLVSDRGKGRGEGIPLTPLEAASCGLPIIVGNHDGSQEAVVKGVNGFVIDPFDLDAHASHLKALAADSTLRSALAAGARQRISQEFTYEGFRRKHEQLAAVLARQ